MFNDTVEVKRIRESMQTTPILLTKKLRDLISKPVFHDRFICLYFCAQHSKKKKKTRMISGKPLRVAKS